MSAPDARRSVRRAAIAAEVRRHDAVEREAGAALAADPSNARAFEVLAWSQLERRLHRDALATALRGLACAPASALLEHIAAVALHRAGDLAAALAHSQRAVTAAPGNATYLSRRARIECDLGERAAAVASAERAMSLATSALPESFVMGEVATVFCACGLDERGLTVAEERAKAFPDDAWAMAGLVRVRALCGDAAGVAEIAPDALAREPNVPWVWAHYAEALDALGDRAGADKAAREALRLNPRTRLGGAAVERVRATG